MTTSLVASQHTFTVLIEVSAERARQDAKWGRQDHPDGTGPDHDNPVRLAATVGEAAVATRAATDRIHSHGTVTFAQILTEEFYEALAETDPAALRTELLQVAATAVCWAEALDRRAGKVAG